MEVTTHTKAVSRLVPLAPAPTRASPLGAYGSFETDRMTAMPFNC